MPDNITLNEGFGGSVIASDDVAGAQYQRVKVAFGADGSAEDTSDTNPFPVMVMNAYRPERLSQLTGNRALDVTGSYIPIHSCPDGETHKVKLFVSNLDGSAAHVVRVTHANDSYAISVPSNEEREMEILLQPTGSTDQLQIRDQDFGASSTVIVHGFAEVWS